ncbi:MULTISPECIES: putative metal-binding motif-containing protein [unclassified Myxococcus]|uniref:putative metal-binding motif-containing protein n=1 Tax=unclassified Myxococcus TaxID=2648731 RepID=UPI001CC0CFAD|nr:MULTISPECIES: putative metal-binding motif-containing protein [unclassified Myxococcus]MBZ4399289.1 putative metal-binding motif-containing protein [Myxococcus sp. AS-1-15]MBZ4411504.1 putative metal-binding motif-containing protein [Myxococcus sp. XM-1-1-1]
MRRIALFLFPLLLLACSKDKEQAGQQVIIKYTKGFHKGCFRIQAEDLADSSRTLVAPPVAPRADRDDEDGGPFVNVAILQKEGWSNRIQVTVSVHEEPCDQNGKLVDTKSEPLTLPGEGVSPNPFVMQFNTPDQDDDGFLPIASGGTDCEDRDREQNIKFAEVCDDKDNNCDGTEDEGFDKKWYLDEDGDGVPRGPDFVSSCTSPGEKYKHHVEGQRFDCKDTGADAEKMFPGNPETCDDVDNDCDDIVDNGFAPRGVTCNPECQGLTVCSGDGTAVVCSKEPGRYYHPDRDGDGQGAKGSARILKCGTEPADPGTVPNDNDCDDADVAARAGLAEVCDAIDNDCDGTVDNTAQACGGTLKNVESYFVTLAGHHWKTVSVGANGHVWVAGDGGKLALRRPGEQKFESFSYYSNAPAPPSDGSLVLNENNCQNKNWTASWVNANGVVFLGGDGGTVAIHPGARGTAAYDCVPAETPGQSRITGMIGFEGDANGPIIYLADSSARLYRWRPSLPVAERFTELNNGDFAYYGVHALAPEFVLAVGGTTTGGTVQKFYSHNVQLQNQTSAANPHTVNPDNVNGNARAVWMGSATSACAVGDNAAVWRWDGGTTWNKVDGPAGVAGRFSGVVMRNDAQSLLTGQCYIVGGDNSSRSKVHRLTTYGWAKPLEIQSSTANVALNDLAITATGEIWIVGEDGRVFHYPEP